MFFTVVLVLVVLVVRLPIVVLVRNILVQRLTTLNVTVRSKMSVLVAIGGGLVNLDYIYNVIRLMSTFLLLYVVFSQLINLHRLQFAPVVSLQEMRLLILMRSASKVLCNFDVLEDISMSMPSSSSS